MPRTAQVARGRRRNGDVDCRALRPHRPDHSGAAQCNAEAPAHFCPGRGSLEPGHPNVAYYHYWFNGRQPLERPLHEVLRTQKPGFPFLLVWANENWTRTWDGGERHVLLGQSYSLADDLADPRWPGVIPGLDNSARNRRDSHIFVRQSPQIYQKWLSQALCRSQDVAQRYEGSEGGVVFLNAWNEWAEGN